MPRVCNPFQACTSKISCNFDGFQFAMSTLFISPSGYTPLNVAKNHSCNFCYKVYLQQTTQQVGMAKRIGPNSKSEDKKFAIILHEINCHFPHIGPCSSAQTSKCSQQPGLQLCFQSCHPPKHMQAGIARRMQPQSELGNKKLFIILHQIACHFHPRNVYIRGQTSKCSQQPGLQLCFRG